MSTPNVTETDPDRAARASVTEEGTVRISDTVTAESRDNTIDRVYYEASR